LAELTSLASGSPLTHLSIGRCCLFQSQIPLNFSQICLNHGQDSLDFDQILEGIYSISYQHRPTRDRTLAGLWTHHIIITTTTMTRLWANIYLAGYSSGTQFSRPSFGALHPQISAMTLHGYVSRICNSESKQLRT